LYGKIFSTDASLVRIDSGDPVASQFQMNEVTEDMGDTAIGGCAAEFQG